MPQPTDIAGLYAWWKADAGTSTTVDGNPISQWDDSSGNGRHLVQGTGAAQPLYKTGQLNGLPGVLADGTDDLMTVTLGADASRTFFYVVKESTATTARNISGFGTTSRIRSKTPTSGGYEFVNDQAAAVQDLGGVTTTTAQLVCIKVVSASSLVAYMNGVQTASFDPNDQITTGTAFQLFASASASFFPGLSFETILYDSALADSDRQWVEQYIWNKWAVGINNGLVDPPPPAQILVRERPPLRQTIDVVGTTGRHYRWGEDEPQAANVYSELRHSSTMPGGFETCDLTLPRKPGIDYSDLERLSTVRVQGPSGSVVGEYRLERAPRVSGDQMAVSPSAVGWQAHLDDDKSAQWIPVDRDMSHWQDATTARRAAIAAATFPTGKISISVGQSGITWDVPVEALPLNEDAEVMYLAPAGVTVAKVGYKGNRVGTWTNLEAANVWTDDNEPLASATSYALTLDDTVRTATVTTPERYLMIRAKVTTGFTPAGVTQQTLSKLAVYSNHGLTTQAISGETDGVLASDVVRYVVQWWAPLLTLKSDSIQPSGFVIPHLAFLDPTTAGEMIRQASRFNLPDWAVWDNREFVWYERGTRGKKWRARIGPSQLEETGPQVDRLWSAITVAYRDVDGTTKTVGPTGSGADTESSFLKDTDPDNPANRLGITRQDVLQMGTSTAAGAIEVGRVFLDAAKLLDSSGRATLTGWVEDDRGVSHPYFDVRAGDQITFVDASDKSYRRIVRADHTRSSRSCSIDLDSPPEGLQALLERLDVVLVPLGV